MNEDRNTPGSAGFRQDPASGPAGLGGVPFASPAAAPGNAARNALEESVLRRVDAHRDELIAFLRRLVAARSLTGSEGLCAPVLTAKLAAMGLEVDEWEIDGAALHAHPAANPSQFGYAGRPNVVGRCRGADPRAGRSLILNGHTDVVTPEPLGTWTRDPWGGEVVGGRLYGRGAVDMKGGIAAMIVALESVQAAGVRPAGDVIVECVIEEEEGVGNGTLASLLRGYNADACVVTEPSGLEVQPSMRGAIRFKITVQGQSCHGVEKWKGVDAIEKGIAVWQLLKPFQDAMSVVNKHPLYDMYPISIPVTADMVRAGAWRGMIAPECVIEGYLETLPGRDTTYWEEVFRTYLTEATAGDPWLRDHPPLVEVGERYEAYEDAATDPFVSTMCRAAGDVTGADCAVTGSDGGSDAYIRHVYGHAPTVVFGPGGGGAHGADEWVDLEQLVQATKVLALTIVRWCGVA
jgi:acetylornithine deacetylase